MTDEEVLIEEDITESLNESEEQIQSHDELLLSIDQKLGLLLEKELADEDKLIEDTEETLNYSEILTDLNTNIVTFTSIYEEELVRLEKEEVLAEKEALAEETEEIIEKDYTEVLVQLDQKLDIFIGISDSVEAAADSVITYSVFYIPLALIIIWLYWFFSQFMNRFY